MGCPGSLACKKVLASRKNVYPSNKNVEKLRKIISFSTKNIKTSVNPNNTDKFIKNVDEFDIITNDNIVMGMSFSDKLIPKGQGYLTNNLGTVYNVTKLSNIISNDGATFFIISAPIDLNLFIIFVKLAIASSPIIS